MWPQITIKFSMWPSVENVCPSLATNHSTIAVSRSVEFMHYTCKKVFKHDVSSRPPGSEQSFMLTKFYAKKRFYFRLVAARQSLAIIQSFQMAS